MHASAIFQRTVSGRHEIQAKGQGLTHSERKVFIVIDGVSPYSVFIKKLDDMPLLRVERALDKLLAKKLIVEVVSTATEAVAENLDALTIAQYVRQEATDPVTIVAFEIDDAFALEMGDGLPVAVLPMAPVPRITSVDFYIPMAGAAPVTQPVATNGHQPAVEIHSAPAGGLPRWAIWLVALGGVVILLSVLMKIFNE